MSITDNVSPISRLPDEVMLQIFSELDSSDLINCTGVSTVWRRIAQDRSLHSDPHSFYNRVYMRYVKLMREEKKLEAEKRGSEDRSEISSSLITTAVTTLNPELQARSETLKAKRTALELERSHCRFKRFAPQSDESVYHLIVKLFENYTTFHEFPIVEIGEQTGDNGYIVITEPDRLKADMVRGKDKFGRIFVACRASFSPEIGKQEQGPQAYLHRFILDMDHRGFIQIETSAFSRLDRLFA